MQEQATSSIAASFLPSSSERSSSSALHAEVKEGMESDDEIRRVPEMAKASSSKKRGRSPGEKENKRLKRLLRNRVSAQQARERKKAYLIELEVRVKELETNNAELQESLSLCKTRTKCSDRYSRAQLPAHMKGESSYLLIYYHHATS